MNHPDKAGNHGEAKNGHDDLDSKPGEEQYCFGPLIGRHRALQIQKWRVSDHLQHITSSFQGQILLQLRSSFLKLRRWLRAKSRQYASVTGRI